MGAGLYRTEPVFAAAMEECGRVIGDIEGDDLIDLMFGEHEDQEAADRRLMQTVVGQPAIFALQYALSRLWASWGVEPAAMIGHSVGELVAACLGGVLSLEDALRLTAVRGRLMQALPVGAMTAVLAEEAIVLPLLDEQISLAAVNAVEQCVASGPPASIDELERRLTAGGIRFRRLGTDRAFHSPMMEPAIDPLRDHVDHIARGDLRIPMVSTVTGTWTTTAEIADPAYWGTHARRTVRFAEAVGMLLRERPDMVLLEIGPGSTLASLTRQHPDLSPDGVIISTLPDRGRESDDAVHARRAVADAWTAGVDIDWPAVNGGSGRRIPLPTYPFARDRYWIDYRPPVDASAPGDLHRPDAPPALEAVATAPGRTNGPPALSRQESIAARLTSILSDLSGLDAAAVDPGATFTDLGFDSLFLTQANAQFRKEYGVRVTLGQLLGETSSVGALATFIDSELGPELAPPDESLADEEDAGPRPEVGPFEHLRAVPVSPGNGRRSAADRIGSLIQEQLRIMEEQLNLMESELTEAKRAITAPTGHDADRAPDDPTLRSAG
jgi:acyl transferase domain-containing protein